MSPTDRSTTPRLRRTLAIAAPLAALAAVGVPAAALTTASAAPAREVTIAAVGDSITKADLPGDSKNRVWLDRVNTETCAGWVCALSRTPEFKVNDGFARGGGMSTHFVQDARRYDRSDYLVLMGGTNDVNSQRLDPTTHSNERVIARYATVIKSSGKPANRVVVSAIAPLNIAPARRQAYNAALKAFAAQHGYHYVDPWSGLDDGSGAYRKGLSSDGVHPTAAGQKTVGANMATALKKVTGAQPPTTTPPTTKPPTSGPATASYPVLQQGARGDRVKVVQTLLNAGGARLAVDGSYGPATTTAVRAFQTSHRLAADGVAGPKTLTALTPHLAQGARGDGVKALQTALVAKGQKVAVDGSFGPDTVRAVKAFQGSAKIGVDGVVGEQTWAALLS